MAHQVYVDTWVVIKPSVLLTDHDGGSAPTSTRFSFEREIQAKRALLS
jgi:hypothetical protein